MNYLPLTVVIASGKRKQPKNIFTTTNYNAIEYKTSSVSALKKLFISIILIFLSLPIFAQPTARFTSNIVSGCVPILVDFIDQSTGNPNEWKWDLGNGTYSNLQNPSATYFNPGKYTVKLTVKNGNNKDSLIKVSYIIVYGSPIVNFKANETIGCSPFTVNFLDATIAGLGTISTRQWDFGDGTLSNQQHPSHTYTLAGNYNVTLKVTNTNGCIATASKTNFIKNSTITAGFTNKLLANCTPNKIIFQNTSTSSGTISYLWDFGDNTTSTISNPTHIFSAGGTYNVKLTVSNQFGCRDSMIKQLQILDPVTAAFSADKLESCSPPLQVQFSNKELPGNTYFWSFGDSIISTLSNPIHLYKDTGNFTVKLIIRNSNGCVDSVKKVNYIKIHNPILEFGNLPDSSCQPFTKQLTVSCISKDSISSYFWDFGDGTTSTSAEPYHTFSNLGYYNISVIGTAISGCKDTVYMSNAIRVTSKPVANFSADIHESCAKTEIQFTNLSTGATKYRWDFGDFSVSHEKNPKHRYSDTGWMTVTLVAMNGGCTDTVVFRKYIHIKPAVAKFIGSLNCTTPFVRSFVSLSRGASRLLWDFGDGTTSTEIAPSHTYPKEGDFDVTLYVWNDSTGCDHSSTKTAKILITTPTFFASDTVVCRGDTVKFSSSLTNPDVYSFAWSFGDGTKRLDTSSNKVTHIYKQSGVYTVKLITTNLLNCRDTLVKSRYISVTAPQANFSVIDTIACVNSPLFFTDNSSPGDNPLQKWIWNYGDGKIDTLTNKPFSHTFKTEGKFPISLKVVDNKGCSDKQTLSSSIQILKLNAKFTLSDTLACPDFPVKFTCATSNPGIFYKWDFGDGTSSTLQTPTHSYSAEGRYTVKVYIRNKTGCEDSCIIVNAIRIGKTVAKFNMSDSFRTCPPLLIQFTNLSSNYREEYWDFGDNTSTNTHNPSHFYTYPGVYTVTLYAKGAGGCIDTMQKKITVNGPTGILKYVPLKSCKPYNVDFKIKSTDAVSYVWDFNDGNTIANSDTAIRYTYSDSGTFIPKIILVDNVGCRVPLTGLDTIINLFANASFLFPDNIICTQNEVAFVNTSTTNDTKATYLWDFGDNTTSTTKNPVHQYLVQGIYYPTLTITTSNGCSGQYKSNIPVKVVPSSGIEILTSGNGCAPLTATVNGSSTEEVATFISWHWDLGNGKTSDLQFPPPQLYNTAGSYNLTLTAVNSNGCPRTVQKIIEAYKVPEIKVSNDTLLCKGQSVTLHASGAEKYNWQTNRGMIADTMNTIKTIPTFNTKYTVTGSSLQGCETKSTITVTVKQPLKMSLCKSDIICYGQSKRLDVSGASQYEWAPAHGLSSNNAGSPLAQPDTTTTYRVIGTDEMGCFKDTGFVTLTVYPIPKVEAGDNKTVVIGQSVTIKPTISKDVTQVTWAPQTNVISSTNDLPDLTVKPKETRQYTIEVKNNGGCKATDNVTVFVICNGTNIFMPNLFTPNNDGVNDVFYPRGTGIYKIKNLRIYGRWGETIFEKNNFNSNDASAGWNGTFKGQKLNPETFVYTMQIICNNNEVLDLNGTIFLAN